MVCGVGDGGGDGNNGGSGSYDHSVGGDVCIRHTRFHHRRLQTKAEPKVV